MLKWTHRPKLCYLKVTKIILNTIGTVLFWFFKGLTIIFLMEPGLLKALTHISTVPETWRYKSTYPQKSIIAFKTHLSNILINHLLREKKELCWFVGVACPQCPQDSFRSYLVYTSGGESKDIPVRHFKHKFINQTHLLLVILESWRQKWSQISLGELLTTHGFFQVCQFAPDGETWSETIRHCISILLTLIEPTFC